jgi:flagellar biosynthesis component FlhA
LSAAKTRVYEFPSGSPASAVKTYTLLTIGAGLVAQIPALVISSAAGILVTRVSSEQQGGPLRFA